MTAICIRGIDKISIAVAERTATVVVALVVHIVLNMPQTAMATMATAKADIFNVFMCVLRWIY